MSIVLDLSPALTHKLKAVPDLNGFVETALNREFNRQRSVQKIQQLAQTISNRPAAKALSDDALAKLLDEL